MEHESDLGVEKPVGMPGPEAEVSIMFRRRSSRNLILLFSLNIEIFKILFKKSQPNIKNVSVIKLVSDA